MSRMPNPLLANVINFENLIRIVRKAEAKDYLSIASDMLVTNFSSTQIIEGLSKINNTTRCYDIIVKLIKASYYDSPLRIQRLTYAYSFQIALNLLDETIRKIPDYILSADLLRSKINARSFISILAVKANISKYCIVTGSNTHLSKSLCNPGCCETACGCLKIQTILSESNRDCTWNNMDDIFTLKKLITNVITKREMKHWAYEENIRLILMGRQCSSFNVFPKELVFAVLDMF